LENKVLKRNPGRPSDKRSTDKNKILRYAIKAFATQGYGGVSINALAKKVGVADSLFHYHFGSKFNLWKSCMRLIGEEILQKLRDLKKLSSNLNGIERIKLFNKQLVLISAKNPEFQQIVVHEMFSDSERSRWLVEDLLKPIYAYFEANLKEEQEKGTIKTVPAANLTSFVIGSITTLFSRSFQMKMLYGIDAFDDKEIDKHAEIINDLLFSGLQNK
jgi:AcrR family transcriptional regulator